MFTGPNISTDGLVLALDAANTKSYPGSGTTWTDVSGNNNNGTLTNGPTFNSANGGSIVFDGVNDYAQTIEYATRATGSFTVAMFYTITMTTGRGGLFERNESSPFNGMSLGQGGADNWAFTVSSNFTTLGPTSALFTYPSTNVWYYDVGIWDGINTVIAYRNGEFVTSTTGPTMGNLDTAGTRQKLTIMSRSTTAIGGKVALVQTYNKALTASEVFQNYNAVKSRFNL